MIVPQLPVPVWRPGYSPAHSVRLSANWTEVGTVCPHGLSTGSPLSTRNFPEPDFGPVTRSKVRSAFDPDLKRLTPAAGITLRCATDRTRELWLRP
jgi:hypothetical protein